MESQSSNIDIHISWVYDDQEISIMPELVDEENNIRKCDFDIFNFFQEYEFNPDDFANRFLPKLKVTYEKYFDIFKFPLYSSTDASTIRFNKIYVIKEFRSEFLELLREYHLENHLVILAHFIAEIFEFKRRHFKDWLSPDGISQLRLIVKDLNLLEKLKHDLHLLNSDNKPYYTEKLSLIIRGKPYEFESEYVIWQDIIRQIDLQSRVSRYKKSPEEITLSSIPYHDNYHSYMQNQIIISLHAFLANETDFPFKKAKAPKLFVIFMMNFLNLCGFPFFASDGNEKKIQEVEFGTIKKAIQRALKKESP